ncbi:cysteine proteinase [Polychaeton citri CBS 116435]|uniref:Ubiquitin carboxyl-terminal hydrolase n=1 Tax=Polychaeton citri CBS 116435 TaxID=1314669 RepID=A0A9P4UTX6_9PEZI|nr:cysteine proteinase [Polychaeton citri CBS 116435]
MSHHPLVYLNKDGKKTFVPLENNPEVFTRLSHNLGLSSELGFYDVYSVNEPDLLALVPRPVYALICILPMDIFYRVRSAQHASGEVKYPKQLTYDGSGPDEPVVWFNQTIGHACGLIALLHGLANGKARDYVKTDSDLHRLLDDAVPLKPSPRAELLYNSQALERAHMAAAVNGDSVPPSAAEPIGYGFLCYVKGKDGHLYDLEGFWGGPIDLGALDEGDDMLSENALSAGIRKFTSEADGNAEFSIIALAPKVEDA